ncbi:hypothetical protein CYLTODRAFT_416814 [Cylindrobasidium torrendii FP15055 ss-10]|uniref:Fork-head domain-containing protein n=1 Tax=Cylindrobasidium torrendii FP15055 ss-10 TaxID=1314674 RepID=A0A0D7BU80_9AGAR|nr:hypothetical protein CYLTODRAFT_416814 [Cylindrobasidium torrendii FP15055 ss-10]
MVPEGLEDDMNNPYFNVSDNDLTGGLPINLDSLRDGPPGTKPFYPYSTLIRYAIKGSPNQKLLLEDIYYAIESRFPYFRSAPAGWKNSVRHNLSLNPCFEKLPRPLTDRGKGSYWVVNDAVDPRTGVHRIRKKKTTKSKQGGRKATGADEEDYSGYQDPPSQPQYTELPGDGSGDNRPPPFPYPPTFDPNFAMRPPFIVPFMPEETVDVLDESGNIDWHKAWLKEIKHLQEVTEQQEKAGADQEFFHGLLMKVRGALMPVPMMPDGSMPLPPHMMPPPPTGPPSDMSQMDTQQAPQ